MNKRKNSSESKPLLFIQQPNFQPSPTNSQRNYHVHMQHSNNTKEVSAVQLQQQQENLPTNLPNDYSEEVPLINQTTLAKIEQLWNRIKSQQTSELSLPEKESIVEDKVDVENESLQQREENKISEDLEKIVEQMETVLEEKLEHTPAALQLEEKLEKNNKVGENNGNELITLDQEPQPELQNNVIDDNTESLTETEIFTAQVEKEEVNKDELLMSDGIVDDEGAVVTSQKPQQDLKAIMRRLALYPRVLERPYCQAVIHGEKVAFQVLSKRGDNVRLKTKNKIIVCKINDIAQFEIIQ